jgi:hypothetical protein
MVEVSKEVRDKEAEEFWTSALDALSTLGEDGMSDEETTEESTVVDGIQISRVVRKVKVLWYRHPNFRTTFLKVDETPENEPAIFSQQSRVFVERVRSGIVDYRNPPKGLPQDVFRPEYLQGLLPLQRKQLEISQEK